MSSLFGHLSAGTAIYLSATPSASKVSKGLLPLLILLAIAPDFDYIALWLFKINTEPRFTHSLLFCLSTGLLGWRFSKTINTQDQASVPWFVFVLSPCSHLVLDLLVGVHSLPIFWPLPLEEISSPIGILPSAGRLSLSNIYFWRNLLIESGVLLPLFGGIVALFQRRICWPLAPKAILAITLIFLIWLVFLTWSLKIHT